MAFIQTARNLIPTLGEKSPLKNTLEFLLERGVGSGHPVLIKDVLVHLKSRGINIARESFQHKVLGESRKNGIFIGVSIRKGIYLIETKEDARLTRKFYFDRIKSEKTRLSTIDRLMREHGWKP